LTSSDPPPVDRAQVLVALAENLDIEEVRRGFGLSREEMAQIFRDAAFVFDIDKLGMWALYVDGASRGNPGPAGAGAVLFDVKGEKRAQDSRYLGETTNNVAEYQALLLGLKLALDQGVKNLHIFADSQLVVQQIKGAYRVKKPHLLPFWRQALQELQKFDMYAISHLDRSFNHEADLLARQAIDRQRRKR
jgi:ribonuclease HI